ncbi:MAG: TIGR00289 family protein [Candidatus Saliniplasma sp.]
MKYAALFSGGKDSALALWKAQKDGLNVEYLVTVFPERDDSYMFHKPNLDLVPDIAESVGIELVKVRTEGEKEKELQDLKEGLENLKIGGIITGAVASSYQYKRLEKLSSQLELELYAPLWGMDQENLLNELLEDEFDVIIVSVAAMGLDEKWLGRKIDKYCVDELEELNDKYGINVAGEGGEYESLVLNAPNFKWAFEVVDADIKWDGHRGEYKINKIKKKRE